MQRYYVDTCIWLNLFKREERFGVKYWEIAEEFIENRDIIISATVLKELMNILKADFAKANTFFKERHTQREPATAQDYQHARTIISEQGFSLSLADCMHIAIAMRMNAILITRDNELIARGREYVFVARPEEINR
jgi:predicted nucleic acid-binding protein